MNYTEEEYYGNKQKTVLESGEVQDIATIKENKQQEVNLPLTILTTCIKTLVSLFGILFYQFKEITYLLRDRLFFYCR